MSSLHAISPLLAGVGALALMLVAVAWVLRR
jgi:hypothetical protein